MTKNLTEFNKNSETADGYRYTCKLCRKNGVLTNPDISKAMRFSTRQYSTRKSRAGLDPILAKRAQKYNITVEHLESLIKSQAGLCACCSKELGDKYCIDHCHTTGAVRGLLCYPCNTGIGMLGDNVEGLRAALQYLER